MVLLTMAAVRVSVSSPVTLLAALKDPIFGRPAKPGALSRPR